MKNLDGAPVIEWVYRRADLSKEKSMLLVATDSEEIRTHIKGIGGRVILTSDIPANGTERCAEAVGLIEEYDIIVNVQGDQPLVHPDEIDAVITALQDKSGHDLVSVYYERITLVEIANQNVVKVVLDKAGFAIDFTRLAVKNICVKHIGIYGYRRSTLVLIAKLPPTSNEQVRSLEQMRWLDNDMKIKMLAASHDSQAIDSPDDLDIMSKMVMLHGLNVDPG